MGKGGTNIIDLEILFCIMKMEDQRWKLSLMELMLSNECELGIELMFYMMLDARSELIKIFQTS